MFEVTQEFKRRLFSTRRGGPYWAMDPELKQGINDAPFRPFFHVRAEKIVIADPIYWNRIGTHEMIFHDNDMAVYFRIPSQLFSLVLKEELGGSQFYRLFISSGPIWPRGWDQTERLKKAVFISSRGLRFPIRERHEQFDKLVSPVYPNMKKIAEQGHLNVYSLPNINFEFESIEYVEKNKSLLFFNHILKARRDYFLSLRKNNLVLVRVYNQLIIFSWDHPWWKIELGEGVYLLEHPFPTRRRGVD